ncbi:hypothetical protein [Pseudonocardia sp. D17]|uniref:hypothetical protein n=1 Tax=Pseudonocardia sp. D17 TaxID=882661 RepID=UPI0030CDF487
MPDGGVGGHGHGHGGPPWIHEGRGGGLPDWTGLDLHWLIGPAALVATVLLATLVYLLVRSLVSWFSAARVRDDGRARWDAAVARYDETARAYAAFECDPGEVLTRPALCDVSWPATARFVDAFAEATALRTDSWPGPAAAAEFVRAAGAAERAWTAAQDAAERARWARFRPGERALLGQALRLLTTARESPFEEERRTAYRRVAQRLAELERRTGFAVPRPVVAALEVRGRPMLADGGRHRREDRATGEAPLPAMQ